MITKSIRTEVLEITQRRMQRRTRDGSCKWTDREFAELCRVYLQWFKEE